MKTVLIVEDEKMIRQGIRTMIQRSGVPVEMIMECSNGEMALEILKSQEIDVMFTDIRMPKMNGIELVTNMQKLEHKPLTVAISGYADFSYAVEMMRLGVREYILKPIEREKLQEILQKLNEEIEAGQRNSLNSKQLSHQQLKYLLLNEQITAEEMETLSKEYGKDMILQKYYICAVPSRDMKKSRDQYIYLHHMEVNDIYLVAEEYLDLLLKNELHQQCVGISSEHSTLFQMKTAYREAVEARKRAFCMNQEKVYYETEEKQIPEGLRLEAEKMTEKESRIQRVQLLGTDKTEEMMRVWKNFFLMVKNERILPTAFEECMDCFFEDVKKTYRNILNDDPDRMTKLSDYYHFSNLDEFETIFMEWVLGLHEKINSQFDTSKNKQKIRQAMDYIQQNYNKDLNMAVVSNYISMNYSLFSYMFKEHTGSNFVNYLKGIRMEEAKKLLAETEMRINEISQQVGYDNEKHFMKSFKASVGVSPSEYRKNTRLR